MVSVHLHVLEVLAYLDRIEIAWQLHDNVSFVHKCKYN